MSDLLGIAFVILALGCALALGNCADRPTLTDCVATCGSPDRVARVEITSNVATCECKDGASDAP